LISLCFALFPIAFNTTAVNNILVVVSNEFNVSMSYLQWVVNSYLLTVTSLIVVGGRLGDLFGRRKMYLIGLAGFILGLIVGAMSGFAWLLIVSRILLAISCALIMPASLSIIDVVFNPESRKTAFSIWGAVVGLGFVMGPLLSGFVTNLFGWRWIFWFSIPLIVMAALVALVAMPESQDKKVDKAIDFGGIVSLSLGIFGIILFLDKSSSWGYASFLSVVVLVISLVVIGLFIWIELKVKNPLINLVHFKEKKFLVGNVVIFSINFSLMGLFYLLGIVFQNKLAFRYNALDSGLAMLPLGVCFFLFSLFSGKLLDWMGEKKAIVIGMLVVFVGALCLAFVPADVFYAQYIVPLMIFGAGIGFVTGPSQMMALSAVAEQNIGEAAGITNMVRYLGGAIGVALTSLIYVAVSKDQLRDLLQRMKLLQIDAQILDGWIVGANSQGQTVFDRMDPEVFSRLMQDAKQALFSGVSAAMLAMGVLCLITTLACFFLVQDRKN
jgi:EmrB/QacA subfamily drug resistance transporter